ncbi:hypothetical protein [Sorangium sp. So ce363]|uniref:hypothetical protein n=1 Tax=Sorangium sp. So ce363 TaxID=3133304 RepID=UPI003F5E9A6D
MQSLESATEALLVRIVPGLADQWQGASPDEIERIEQLAPGPLPAFYRWFLGKTGRSMGPMAYPSLDFSAQRVLWCYDEALQVAPSRRFFLIGYETDEHKQLHVFYDLERGAGPRDTVPAVVEPAACVRRSDRSDRVAHRLVDG